MKKNPFALLFLLLISPFLFSQSTNCVDASLLCVGSNSMTFQNLTNYPSTPDGIDYECLGSYPNKQWFTIKIGSAGNLNFQISQTNLSESPIDVDFIVWGPFDSPSCGAANLNPATTVDCSFSASAFENFSINNAVANQYYTLMIANFSGVQGNITISQTNYGQAGSASTNCDIMCPLTLGPDILICQNTTVVLTASISGGTYQWYSSTEGLLPDTTQSIFITPSTSTTYTVIVNKPGCAANITDSITVNTLNLVYQQPNDLIQCSATGTATFDLTSNIPVILENLNIAYYTVMFHLTEFDAQNLINPINNPSSFSATNNQIIYASIVDDGPNGASCIYVSSFEVVVLSNENPIVTASSFAQTVTVNATGNGVYQYQIDNEPFQNSNVFENVAIGNHTINVISTNGCGSGSTTIEISIPNAPDALSPQYFNNGNTVANLVANGENIQWYSNATGRNSLFQTTSTPLPLDTLLIDGNTYFASQTVSGIESENRTAVVAFLNPLSFDNFAFNQLLYSPNPVKNNLTISNNSSIDSVEITSVLGQKMLSQKVNSLQTDIDMSALSNGIYFVKLTAEGHEKTVKIVKE